MSHINFKKQVEGPKSKEVANSILKSYRNRRKQAKNGEIYYAVGRLCKSRLRLYEVEGPRSTSGSHDPHACYSPKVYRIKRLKRRYGVTWFSKNQFCMDA